MSEDTTAEKNADVEEEDEETSDAAEAVMKMMRMQYGMMMGGAKGVTGLAKLAETFLDSLGDKTEVSESDLSDFFEKLPEGLASATKSTLEKAEELPQEMVDAFRRYSKS